MSKKNVENLLDKKIEEIFAERFSNYSKYIIQERALPDVRDGLKPVQRRIIFAMHTEGNTSSKQYRKSAKTVGNVIGNYHPHGDSSVYDAMVRMSQDFKMRQQLIDMHGNNGSVDGDRAAAMRYTEARLSKYSDNLMQDIEKNTVDMIPNFDDTMHEPVVLPNKVPNLLINGASGISAGYATDIPPHNPTEIIDATLYLNNNPECQLEELTKIVPGPDFPTGGIVYVNDVNKIYSSGRGKVVIRAKAEVKDNEIIITEIPFDVNKAVLVNKIDQIRINQEIPGIAEVLDHSDQHGMNISIKLKKDANSGIIWNYLLKQTSLQQNYNYNVIAINKKRPEQLGLKAILEAFLKHRDQVIYRRSDFELEKAKTRLHIVNGLYIAILELDRVVEVIRNSTDKSDAKLHLKKEFKVDDLQAEAIVMMQLYKLTNTDVTVLIDEKNNLLGEISSLEKIVSSSKKRKEIINVELIEQKKLFKSIRKSQIIIGDAEIKVDKVDLVQEENIVMLITKFGFIKRCSLRSFLSSTQKPTINENDEIVNYFMTTTKMGITVFFSNGKFINFDSFLIEDTKWKDKLEHISKYLNIEDGLQVSKMIVRKLNTEIVSITQKGYVTRFDIKSFEKFSSKRLSVFQNVKNDDQIVTIKEVNEKDDKIIFLANNDEYIIKNTEFFPLGNLRRRGNLVGRLKKNQELINFSMGPEILLISNRGSCFKTNLDNIEHKTVFTKLFTNQKTNKHTIIFMDKNQDKKINIINSQNLWYNIDVYKIKIMNNDEKLKTLHKENISSVHWEIDITKGLL